MTSTPTGGVAHSEKPAGKCIRPRLPLWLAEPGTVGRLSPKEEIHLETKRVVCQNTWRHSA